MRYHPKKGWGPVKSSGSGILKKPNNYYNFYSPRPSNLPSHKLRQFHSSYRHPHQKHGAHSNVHHSYKEWHPTHPLLNLNHHHPLCPLCHLAAWKKPRRSGYGGDSFFRRSPRLPSFAPSNIFSKLHSPRIKQLPLFSHSPKIRPFFHSSGSHHAPKLPSYFRDFSGVSDFPKFNDFPKFSPPNYSKSKPYYDYPKSSSYSKVRYPSSSPNSSLYSKLKSYHPVSHSPPKSTRSQFPKDFSDFGFGGFGSGKSGHGWGGWDW